MTELLTQAELLRYSRHLMIPEVGLSGQQRLKDASVLIVGSGGLGSPIALYLAAAGIGRIGIVDYDVVEESNLQRQVIHSNQNIGQPKTESARERLLELNPHIQVDTYNQAFTAADAEIIASEYEILIDGSDNFPTRYLLNDLAVLTKKPYVYGSVYQFEGHVAVFDARKGPCYRCMLPEPPQKTSALSLGNSGIFGLIPGIIGSIQAAEVVKLILDIGEPLIGKMLLLDALQMTFQIIHLRKNKDCEICGNNPKITSLHDRLGTYAVPVKSNTPVRAVTGGNMEAKELARLMAAGAPLTLIDVREPVEQQVSTLPGAISIPLERLPHRAKALDPTQMYVLFCRTGRRSADGVDWMAEAGFKQVFNLVGGINAWADQIDPQMLQY